MGSTGMAEGMRPVLSACAGLALSEHPSGPQRDDGPFESWPSLSEQQPLPPPFDLPVICVSEHVSSQRPDATQSPAATAAVAAANRRASAGPVLSIHLSVGVLAAAEEQSEHLNNIIQKIMHPREDFPGKPTHGGLQLPSGR